jgi:hypothetical protein
MEAMDQFHFGSYCSNITSLNIKFKAEFVRLMKEVMKHTHRIAILARLLCYYLYTGEH